MSYRQVASVLDHAPASLTPAEVLVLVAIAEASRGPGDRRPISTTDLARRARLTRSSLRDAIIRLGKHGIRIRVAIGNDRHGRPLYALPGVVPRWTLPDFAAPAGCACEGCRQGVDGSAPATADKGQDSTGQGVDQATPTAKPQASVGVDTATPTNEGVDTTTAGVDQATAGVVTATPGVDQATPYPSRAVPVFDQRARTCLDHIREQTGATDDESEWILKTVIKRYRPRKLVPYVRGINKADLRDLLGEFRDARQPAPGTGMPDACGKCGPNRLIQLADGRAKRCPTCHPGAARRTA